MNFQTQNPQNLDDAFDRALSGQPSYELNPQITQDYFQRGVMDPMLRQFDREIAPRIAGSLAGQGATFSSRRGDITAQALGDLQTQALGELSRVVREDTLLSAQLAEQAAQRSLQATQISPVVTDAQGRRMALQQQLSAPFQRREDQLTQAKYQEFMRRQPENSPWLQQAMTFTGQPHMMAYNPNNPIGGAFGGAVGGATSMGTVFGPAGGLLGGILGGIGGAFS